MIKQKENDLILAMAGNLDLTPTDLLEVGVNSSNTSLQDKEVYLGNKQIQEMDIFKNNDGEFDKQLFSDFYDQAKKNFALMEFIEKDKNRDKLIDEANKDKALHSSDYLWAPNSTTIDQTTGKTVTDFNGKNTFDALNTTHFSRSINPLMNSYSTERLGKVSESPWSAEEIAQKNRVYDPATDTWEDAPNDLWLGGHWSDVLVMAQYDEDTTDPDGTVHKKGSLKLDPVTGRYYYEHLNGRNVYNKRVFNRFNNLTEDGSTLNKFDFFDSDDKGEKSLLGSIAKTSVLVGSLFIPYVGKYLAGLSVANQTLGMIGGLSKLFYGDDNSWGNTMQGWSKQWERTARTEYASDKDNTWCTENILNMATDCFAQLAEQRWLFQAAPKLFGNKDAIKALESTVTAEEKAKGITSYSKTVEEVAKRYQGQVKNIIQKTGKPLSLEQSVQTEMADAVLAYEKAQKYVDNMIKYNQKLGANLSQVWMTGLVTQDAYSEAKAAGATDAEAFTFAVSWAVAEMGILKSDLGEHILPELKLQQAQMRQLQKQAAKQFMENGTLGAVTENVSKQEAKKAFNNIYQKVQNFVKTRNDVWTNSYAKNIMSQGLGEGIEEVSEDLTADLIKSGFELKRYLADEEKLDWDPWEDWGTRYLQSFVGGALGGSANGAFTDFKPFKELATAYDYKDDPEKSAAENSAARKKLLTQQMISIVRDKEQYDLFKKALDKADLGLSDVLSNERDENDLFYIANDEHESQNHAAKRAILAQMDYIKNILDSERVNVSPNDVLSSLCREDLDLVLGASLRNRLANSDAALLHLNRHQSLQADFVATCDKVKQLETGNGDQPRKRTETEEEEYQLAKKQKEILKSQLNDFINGKAQPSFIGMALFEMVPGLHENFGNAFSFKDFAKSKYGITDFTKENPNKLKLIELEYKQLKEVKGPEYLYQSYTMFNNLAQASKDNLNKSLTLFKEAAQQLTQEIKDACTNLKIALNQFHGNFEQNPDEAISQFIKLYGNKLNAGNIEDLEKAIDDNLELLFRWEVLEEEEGEVVGNSAMAEFFNKLAEKETPISSDALQEALEQILHNKTILEALNDHVEPTTLVFPNNVTPKELTALQNLKHLLLKADLSGRGIDEFADRLKAQLHVNVLTDYLKSYQTKYLNPATKHYINEFINALEKDGLTNQEEFDAIKASINSTPSFDLFNILNNFIQDTTKSDQVENILAVLNDTLLAYRNGLKINLASYSMGDESLEYLKTIISQLKALKSLVYSFSKDSASMANVKGYSPVVNSLYSKIDPAYKALPELDYADAQALQDEIQLFMNYLQAFVKIDDYNSGNKLKEETIYEVNYAINYFREVKTFFNALDDDDKGKLKLGDYRILDERLTTADEEAKKPVEEKKNKLEIYNLQGDAKKNFFKEYVKLQSDLHKFLNDLDPNTLQKCFNAYFKREGGSTLLNRVLTDYEADYTSDTLNPAIFINHLMANKALNRALFEFKYGEIISNHVSNDVADLAVLQGQKQNLYLATALFANRGVINSIATMGNSFLTKFLEDKNNHSACKDLFNGAEYKYMEKAPKWFTTLVTALNMMLIEGLAGTGKSSAVLTLLMEIAKSLNKDAAPMEKVWISNSGVGDDVKNAQGLIDKWDDKKLINKASCQAFNHDLLMRRIYPDYLYNSKDKTLEKPELVIKSDGTISLDLSSIKEDPNAPSMIIIDEASFYTQADMFILEAYCKVNNILLYSGGDFDQNSMELKIPNKGSNGQDAYAANTRQMFYRGEKITTVLRTDNSLLTEGTRAIQKTINNNNYTANVLIYSGPDGVRGIYTKKDAFETDSLEGIIVQARDTDPAATFMLIAKDINPSSNPLVKYLNEKLGDKLIRYTPETAQGNEADYSIVDATGVDRKELGRYVYTGTSRAKKASFAFNTQTLSVKPAGVMKLKRERLSDSIKLTSVQNELAKIKSLADDKTFDEFKSKAIEIKTKPAFGSDTSGTAGVEVAPAPAPEPSPTGGGSTPTPSPDSTPESTPEPAPSTTTTTTTGSEPEGPEEAPEVEETPPTGSGASPTYNLTLVAALLFERAEEWEGHDTREEAQNPDLNNYKEYKFSKDSKWVDREDSEQTVTVLGILGYERNGKYYTVVIFNDGTSTRALLPKLFTDKYKPEGEEEVQNPDVDGDIPLLVEVTDDDSAVLADDASAGTTQDPFQAMPTNGGPEHDDTLMSEGTPQKCFPDAPSSLTSSGVVGMGYSFNQFLFNLTPGGTPAPDAIADIEKHRIDGYHAFVNILRALVKPEDLDKLEKDLDNLNGKTRMYTIVRDYFIGVHNIMYYTKQDDAKKAYIDFVKQLVKKYKHNEGVEGEEGFNVELSKDIKETDIQFMFGIKSRVDPSAGYKTGGYFKDAFGIYAKNPSESNDLLPTPSSSDPNTNRHEIDKIPRKSLVMDIAVWDPIKQIYVSTAEHEVMGYANPITVLSYTDDGGKLLFETYYNKYTSLRNANPKESHAVHLRQVNESIKKDIDDWLDKIKSELGLELKTYDKWPEDKRNEYNLIKNLYNLIYVYTEITDNSFWDIRMHPKYANNTSFWPADYNIRGLEVVNDERHMELQPTFMPEEKPIAEVLSDNGIIASPLMINVAKRNKYKDDSVLLDFLSGRAFMICTSDLSYKKDPNESLQDYANRMLKAYLKLEKEKNTSKNPPKFFRYWVIPPAYSLEEYLNYTSERLTLAQSKNTAELANLPPMGSIDTSLHILKVMLDKGIFDNLGITGKNGNWTDDDMAKVKQYINKIYEAYNNKTDSKERRQLLLDPAHPLAFHCIGSKNHVLVTSFHSFTARAAAKNVSHYKFLNILLNKLLYTQDSVSQKFVLKDGILKQVSDAWDEHIKSNPKHTIRIASKKGVDVKGDIKLVHTQGSQSDNELDQYLAIKVGPKDPKSYLMNGKVEMANLYDHDEYTLLGDMLLYMTECHSRLLGDENKKYRDIRNKYNTKYIQKDLFFSKTTPPAAKTNIDLIQDALYPYDPYKEIKGDTINELCKNAAAKGLLVYKAKDEYKVLKTATIQEFKGRTIEWLSDKKFKLKKDGSSECTYEIVQNSTDFKALCVSKKEAENHSIVETVKIQLNSDGTSSVELSLFKQTIKANVEQFIKEKIGLNLTEDEIKKYLDLYLKFENKKVFKSPSNIAIAIQEFITTYSSELSEDDKDKITKVFTRCGNGAAIIGTGAKLFDSASNEERENYQGYRQFPLVRFKMLMDIYLNTSVTLGNPSNSGTIETLKLVIPNRVKELWGSREDTGMTFNIKINNTEYKVKQIDASANQIVFESGAILQMDGNTLKLDQEDVTTIEPINIDNIPTCGTITI